jgi:hypothetical protein
VPLIHLSTDDECEIAVVLGLIDGGIGCRIEDQLRRKSIQPRCNLARFGEVECRAPGGEQSSHTGEPCGKRAPHLPSRPGH